MPATPPACRFPAACSTRRSTIARGRAGLPGRPERQRQDQPAPRARRDRRAVGRGRAGRRRSAHARAGASGRAYLTYLPASRDIPWPLLARDLIALGGGDADVDGLELERAARPADRHALDRRAQPGADRPGAGAAAEAAAARRADRQSRSALADPADGAGPRRSSAQGGRAALVAIHDLDAAARYADRIAGHGRGPDRRRGPRRPACRRDFRGRAGRRARGRPVRPPADPRSSP